MWLSPWVGWGWQMQVDTQDMTFLNGGEPVNTQRWLHKAGGHKTKLQPPRAPQIPTGSSGCGWPASELVPISGTQTQQQGECLLCIFCLPSWVTCPSLNQPWWLGCRICWLVGLGLLPTLGTRSRVHSTRPLRAESQARLPSQRKFGLLSLGDGGMGDRQTRTTNMRQWEALHQVT